MAQNGITPQDPDFDDDFDDDDDRNVVDPEEQTELGDDFLDDLDLVLTDEP